MELIKCATRAARTVCQHCGKGGVNRDDSDQLYWGHDLSATGDRPCKRCNGAMRSWVLLNPDGSRHDCRGKYGYAEPAAMGATAPRPFGFGSAVASTATVEPEPYVTPEPVSWEPAQEPAPKAAAPAPKGAGERLDLLNNLLELMAPKVDEDQVRGILAEEMAGLTAAYSAAMDAKLAEFKVPRRIAVSLPGKGEPTVITGAHPLLESVLTHRIPALSAGGRPVMLIGPAGSGKTHLVKQVAKALDLPYFYRTIHPTMTETALVGYNTANGNYVRTPLRDAIEFGGVYLFNEVDAGNPAVLVAMNEIIAANPGEMISFPDGMVEKHANFIPFADANTFGKGADRVYVGRNPLDGAFLNRWSVVHMDYDQAVEQAICEATGADSRTVGEVVRYVRDLRSSIARERMPVVLSMRDSVSCCAVIAAGLPAREAVESEIRRGLSDQDWRKISSTVRDFYL